MMKNITFKVVLIALLFTACLSAHSKDHNMKDMYDLVVRSTDSPTVSLKYAEELYKEARKNNSKEYTFKALSMKGYNMCVIGRYDDAAKYYNQAIDSAPDSISIAYTYNNLAWTHREAGNFEKALSSIFQSIAICEKLDNAYMGNVLSMAGSIYIEINQMDKAFSYIHKALKYNNEKGSIESQITSIIDLAYYYQITKQFDQAERYNLLAEESLEKYKGPKKKYFKANIYSNLGSLYLIQGKSNVRIYLDSALFLSNETNNVSVKKEALSSLKKLADRERNYTLYAYSDMQLDLIEDESSQIKKAYYDYIQDKNEKEIYLAKEKLDARTSYIIMLSIISSVFLFLIIRLIIVNIRMKKLNEAIST